MTTVDTTERVPSPESRVPAEQHVYFFGSGRADGTRDMKGVLGGKGAGLAAQSANPRFAYDSYRRFIQMYGDVVLGVPIHDFEHLLKAKRITAGVETDAELGEEALRNLVEEYKALVRHRTGAEFPADPSAQLWGAIVAVWKSWLLKKAVDYRRVNGIA